MNAFSRQGKALPIEVRNQIIENWLDNEGLANILQQVNLPYKTVSNIVDLWANTGSIEPREADRAGVRTT
jgi:predicted transcriptional regulator